MTERDRAYTDRQIKWLKREIYFDQISLDETHRYIQFHRKEEVRLQERLKSLQSNLLEAQEELLEGEVNSEEV